MSNIERKPGKLSIPNRKCVLPMGGPGGASLVCNSTLAGVTLSSSNLQVWFPSGKDFHADPKEYFTPTIVAPPAALEVRPATFVCARHEVK